VEILSLSASPPREPGPSAGCATTTAMNRRSRPRGGTVATSAPYVGRTKTGDAQETTTMRAASLLATRSDTACPTPRSTTPTWRYRGGHLKAADDIAGHGVITSSPKLDLASPLLSLVTCRRSWSVSSIERRN
jgi:hypothetical protein